MRRHRLIAAAATLLTMLAADRTPAAAQRGPRTDKPTGAEIALQARRMRLDRANAGLGEFQGKRISFTPAVLDRRADLAAGQVIGLLENDVAGDETGLPAGRYNVFAAQLADGWHVWAEAGGQIVREALRVTVTARKGAVAAQKPRIRPVGWGVDIDRTREDFPPPPPPVATINIVATNSAPLLINEKRQYAIELRDAAGNLLTGRSVGWASSAPAIVGAPSLAVASGVAGGSAVLTATAEGKTAQLAVQVTPPQYRIYLGGAVNVVNGAYVATTSVAGYATLSANPYASLCYYPCPTVNWSEVTWTSSAPTIVRVVAGPNGQANAYGVVEGTATVTAGYRGAVMPVTVTVGPAKVAWIAMTPASLTVNQGLTQQLSAVVHDATGAIVTDRSITWRSTAPSIADVTATGRVAGITPGDAMISAYVDNVATSVPVHVIPPAVATVTIDPTTISVEQNQWGTLTPTLRDQSGATLTDRSIVWTSSNPAIAEVTYNGRVVGVAAGVATITATSEGRFGRATATVTAPAVAGTEQLTESISFNW